MTTTTSYELKIDGQIHQLHDGRLYCDLFPESSVGPEDSSRLRVEFGTDMALAALTAAGFEFDDCRQQLATGTAPATAAVQQFLQSCEAVTEIREFADRFEFDYDPAVEVSYVPEHLGIEW